MPYTTTGLKQDHKRTLFMELHNTLTHETTRLDIRQEVPQSMSDIRLDASSRHAHVWNFDTTQRQYVATNCGVFGCACCDDIYNRIERVGRMQKH